MLLFGIGTVLVIISVSLGKLFDRPSGFTQDASHYKVFLRLDANGDRLLSRDELASVPGITTEILDYVFGRLLSIGTAERSKRLATRPADHLDYTEFMWFYRESEMFEKYGVPARIPAHLYSFPSWPGLHAHPLAEERHDLDPATFWANYVKPHKGVVIRNALVGSRAMSHWSDPSYLTEKFGDLDAKLETRLESRGDHVSAKTHRVGRSKIRDVVNGVIDGYVVSVVPQSMAWEVNVPMCVLCGKRERPYLNLSKNNFSSFITEIEETSLWISRGTTRSQFHYDKENTFNCLVTGNPKEWLLLDTRKYAHLVPWARQGGFNQTNDLFNMYTDWVGINVDDLDLELHSYLVDQNVVFEKVTQYPGDCVFLPYSMLHYAGHFDENSTSVEKTLQVAVSYMWLQQVVYDEVSCPVNILKPLPLAVFDTTWFFGGTGTIPQGHLDPRDIEKQFIDQTTGEWDPLAVFRFLPMDEKIIENPRFDYVLNSMNRIAPLAKKKRDVPLDLWLHLATAIDMGTLDCNVGFEYVPRSLKEMNSMLEYLYGVIGWREEL